jgi:T4-like virus tail tube protein gp19
MPVRTFTGGNFQLMLDGLKCGFLKSVDGGAPVGDVISEPGSTYFTKKHLGTINYEPLVLQFGLAMAGQLYDWINASWNNKYARKNGAVVATDVNFNAVSQREFFNALISETTIPALDGSSKEPGYLTLKVAPEYTRISKGSGKVTDIAGATQKLWLPSNFKVTIDGLDCTKIRAVDSFTVKQAAATDDIGDARDYQRQAARLEFPNLKITLLESSAQSWFDWFDDFAMKGNNDDSKEKTGSIAFLSPNLAGELMRIDLFNLGIFRIGYDKRNANSDGAATVTAHLYCERMELHLAAAKPVADTRAVTDRTQVTASRAARARTAKGKRKK